ncbi:hypothetical protein CANARDRAFT_27898 [[Candida] arabinofermentans NRRL YB-2248]|uniref:Uncharacterized protein n=1 Tax=[Candida] arabinofermentans NRRL YB-2248 TaxID=983967 RepID=A0A1E4T225_9ASCO|nr:hypothetical protein CANARDRAFT_27898 [[Candida] arabinofermentans NRRL YB-2248]
MLNKIKISKLINDDNLIDIYEILMIDCELLLSKLYQLLSISNASKSNESGDNAHESNDTVTKIVKKFMYCSNYVGIKEFKKLVLILVNKFGKVFYEDALKEFDDKDLISKCKGDNVDGLVDLYLKEICESYDIDLFGEKKEKKADDDDDNAEAGGEDDDGEGGTGEGVLESKKEAVAVSTEDETVKAKPVDAIDDLKKRFEALKRV